MECAGDLIRQHDLALPVLSANTRGESASLWFPIPGMYGGFKYWFEGEGDALKLITESWCRVVSGSGLRHEITSAGAVLVSEGFV